MLDKAIVRMRRTQFISDMLKSPSLQQFSELEPHVRLLGPMPELLPLYVRSVKRGSDSSKPDDWPWRMDCFCPLPKSLGNPCLDLFLFVGPSSTRLSMHALLELAWNDNPLTTLKLILNMRELLREYSEFPLISGFTITIPKPWHST